MKIAAAIACTLIAAQAVAQEIKGGPAFGNPNSLAVGDMVRVSGHYSYGCPDAKTLPQTTFDYDRRDRECLQVGNGLIGRVEKTDVQSERPSWLKDGDQFQLCVRFAQWPKGCLWMQRSHVILAKG